MDIGKTNKMDKDTLINVFNNCLNVLRDCEALTGEKALRNLTYLFTLKLIEPRIDNGINLSEYQFTIPSHYEDLDTFKKMLSYAKFSNLSKINETEIKPYVQYLWDDILSEHSFIKQVFLKNRMFDIQHSSTFVKLFKLLNIDLKGTDYDVLGDAYEELLKDIMQGRVLGQFFTPPEIKKIMMGLINPKIHDDGTIESCCDPTMGTGGFLISYLQAIESDANNRNIDIKWDNVVKNIYGKEIERDTYQLAAANLLISSGYSYDIELGDSLRSPIKRKFDIVLANPPFGISGLNYDEFPIDVQYSEYLPFKSKNAVSLFIQVIIDILNINGRCAVVVPNGKELFSKTVEYVNVRKYLMKSCDLQKIIHVANEFKNTSISTCILYFIKLTDKVVNIDKKKRVKYEFIDGHATKNIEFYDNDKLLTSVDINTIVANNYSLNYKNYIVNKQQEFKYDYKKLGELCDFLPKSKRNASYGDNIGLYPFFTSSYCEKRCNEYDYEDECLIIGTGGKANIKYSSKFSCSADNFVIKIKNILCKYVYYYLFNNIHILQDGFVGTALQHISKDYVSNIKIPIPTVECQREIIEQCEADDKLIEQLKTEIEKTKLHTKQFLNDMLSSNL